MMLLVLVSSCLQYSNSAINPVLYAFLSDHFKKSFRDTCRCLTRESRFQSRYRQREITFTTRRTRRGPRFTAILQVSKISQKHASKKAATTYWWKTNHQLQSDMIHDSLSIRPPRSEKLHKELYCKRYANIFL